MLWCSLGDLYSYTASSKNKRAICCFWDRCKLTKYVSRLCCIKMQTIYSLKCNKQSSPAEVKVQFQVILTFVVCATVDLKP